MMKYIGMIILIMSSTGLGLRLSNKIKHRIDICSELSGLCDELSLDLNYKITPIEKLFNSKLVGRKSLEFITFEAVKTPLAVNSDLSRDENKELGEFLYSLGKSDVKSQLKLISGFKKYIDYSKNQYIEQYKRNSRVYISLGFFSGIIISLVLI